ncbi:hypothetical protein FEI13_01845 [Halomonas urmiana]|uniref:Alpha/beta hydrolase n=1 Tax=Halomonas urmiana TaxID=490901 RepID=A0A5R8MM64_9GAMM|nr:hypothetical protein [Halomonas urmiana]TLF53363.1 hypothetical protein FEI13_01845 [Halomonas urmiana]
MLPMLMLHADDDPFMPPALFTRFPRPSPAVRVELARHGGHVGFVEWHQGRLTSWLARRFSQQLREWQSTKSAPHSALGSVRHK